MVVLPAVLSNLAGHVRMLFLQHARQFVAMERMSKERSVTMGMCLLWINARVTVLDRSMDGAVVVEV